MHRRYGGIPDFDTQVTTGNHDGIGCFQNAFKVFDSLGAFDFCHQASIAAFGTYQRAGIFHIGTITREGDGDIVCADGAGRFNIFLVLLRQRCRGEAATGTVDALVIG